jgi:hypothetical protein
MKELITIQSELKAPKNQRNSFGNYNYRSCEDVLEALKPLLAKHECLLNISDTIEYIGERFYVKATATITNAKGLQMSSTAYAREEETKKGMDGSQLTGSSSSYARKYALNGLFLIDDTKDADTMPPSTSEKPQLKTEVKSEPKTALTPCDMATFDKMTTSAKQADTAEKKQAVLNKATNNYSLSPEQLALLTSLCK